MFMSLNSKMIRPVTQSNLSKHLVWHLCSNITHTRNTGIPLKDIVIQLTPGDDVITHEGQKRKLI